MKSNYKIEWQKAMEEEIDLLLKNETWSMEVLSQEGQPSRINGYSA